MTNAIVEYAKEAKKSKLAIFSGMCAVAAIVLAGLSNPANRQAPQLAVDFQNAIAHQPISELVAAESDHVFVQAIYGNGKVAAKSRGMPGNILFPPPVNGFSKICFKAAWDLRENRPWGKFNHTSWSDDFLVSAKIALQEAESKKIGLVVLNTKELSCITAPESANLRGVKLELLPSTAKNIKAPELRIMAHAYTEAMKQGFDDERSFERLRNAIIAISALWFIGSGSIGSEARRAKKALREHNTGEFEALSEADEFSKSIPEGQGKGPSHRL